MYTTFKFYKGKKRLAIFHKDGLTTVIPCSTGDQFSKKHAKLLFNNGEGKGYFCYRIENDFKKQSEFLEWCSKNYFKAIEFEIGVEDILKMDVKKIYKMDRDSDKKIVVTALYKSLI